MKLIVYLAVAGLGIGSTIWGNGPGFMKVIDLCVTGGLIGAALKELVITLKEKP